MASLLLLTIAAAGSWAALRLVQVRRLTVRYERVLHRNLEQDRPHKG